MFKRAFTKFDKVDRPDWWYDFQLCKFVIYISSFNYIFCLSDEIIGIERCVKHVKRQACAYLAGCIN
jgi:hypothetical protein